MGEKPQTDAVVHDVSVPLEAIVPTEAVPTLDGWDLRFSERENLRVRSVEIDPIVRMRASELITFMRTRARINGCRVKLPVGPTHTWPHGMHSERLSDLRTAVRVLLQEQGEIVASHDPLPTAWLIGPIIGNGTTKPRFIVGAPKPAD